MRSFFVFCIVVALFVVTPVSAQIPIGGSGNLLAVGNYNVNQGSSDLGAVIQLETDKGTIVIDEGHPVTYFFNQSDNNLDGVTDWMLFDYDDSDWDDGLSAVGYNCVQTTDVPDTNDQGAIYSRFKLFNLSNASTINSMTIRIDYDDGVIVWLNEVEVLRSNMITAEEVPNWNWGSSENHESTNIAAPNPNRWDAQVSNLLEVGQDNPEGTIIEYEFEVAPGRISVDPAHKFATWWGSIKKGQH